MKKRKYEIAKHAYKTVPYYRELAEKNGEIRDVLQNKCGWEKLPLVEKDGMVVKQNRFLSEEYSGYLYGKNVVHTNTSGTTGICLDFFWRRQDYNASLLPLWMKRYHLASIRTKSLGCFFIDVLEENKSYECIENNLFISKVLLNRMRYHELNKLLLDFKPTWMIIYPGLAMYLCDLIETGKIELIDSVKYIELTGERVLEASKNRIANMFKCYVAEHYGTKEVNAIGFKTEQDRYEVFENSVYIEVLDDDGNVVQNGKEGNIYVTSMHNYLMPFIRYSTGDRGILVKENYKNRQRKYLQLIVSRKNDLLVRNDKSKIFPDELFVPIEVINNFYGNVVYQFQAVQMEINKVLLRVNKDKDFQCNLFIENYIQIFKDVSMLKISFEFEFVDYISPGVGSGKTGWFKSNIITDL